MIKCESLNYDDFVRVFLRDLRVSLVKEVIIEFCKQLKHEICLFIEAVVALQIGTIYPQAQKYMYYWIFQEKLMFWCKKMKSESI